MTKGYKKVVVVAEDYSFRLPQVFRLHARLLRGRRRHVVDNITWVPIGNKDFLQYRRLDPRRPLMRSMWRSTAPLRMNFLSQYDQAGRDQADDRAAPASPSTRAGAGAPRARPRPILASARPRPAPSPTIGTIPKWKMLRRRLQEAIPATCPPLRSATDEGMAMMQALDGPGDPLQAEQRKPARPRRARPSTTPWHGRLDETQCGRRYLPDQVAQGEDGQSLQQGGRGHHEWIRPTRTPENGFWPWDRSAAPYSASSAQVEDQTMAEALQLQRTHPAVLRLILEGVN